MNRKLGQRATLRTPDPGLNDRVHLKNSIAVPHKQVRRLCFWRLLQ